MTSWFQALTPALTITCWMNATPSHHPFLIPLIQADTPAADICLEEESSVLWKIERFSWLIHLKLEQTFWIYFMKRNLVSSLWWFHFDKMGVFVFCVVMQNWICLNIKEHQSESSLVYKLETCVKTGLFHLMSWNISKFNCTPQSM